MVRIFVQLFLMMLSVSVLATAASCPPYSNTEKIKNDTIGNLVQMLRHCPTPAEWATRGGRFAEHAQAFDYLERCTPCVLRALNKGEVIVPRLYVGAHVQLGYKLFEFQRHALIHNEFECLRATGCPCIDIDVFIKQLKCAVIASRLR